MPAERPTTRIRIPPRAKYAPEYHAQDCDVRKPPAGYGPCTCGVDHEDPGELKWGGK